jgi:hypothetical protein
MTGSRVHLDEVLGDPMVRLVMARDRVRPEEIRVLFEKAHKRAAQRKASAGVIVPPAHVIDCQQRLCA